MRRQLGLSAVAALVVGDMLGTGVFFTPGEVASVAQSPWQVYLLWGLCGAITLCGALTAAELTTLLPHAGASYHIIREGFGPFPAFLKIWCIPITQAERREGHLNVVVTEHSRRAVGFESAARVGAEMARHGFELSTFPSDELFIGRGGAHCMTCPLLVR